MADENHKRNRHHARKTKHKASPDHRHTHKKVHIHAGLKHDVEAEAQAFKAWLTELFSEPIEFATHTHAKKSHKKSSSHSHSHDHHDEEHDDHHKIAKA